MDLKRFVYLLWLPVSILAAWEISAAKGIVDPLFFPPSSALAAASGEMIRSGELGRELGITLTRMLQGYLLGASVGLLSGVFMGASTAVRRSLEPLITALYTTPKLAILPLLIMVLGIGEAVRIALVALGSFIMVAIHALDAVRGVNPTHLDVARNYGASRLLILRRVYWPASLPRTFTGLRLALGRALMITVAVELISCPDGMGAMLWMAAQTFESEKLYIGVLVISGLGTLTHASMRRLEAWIVPWRQA